MLRRGFGELPALIRGVGAREEPEDAILWPTLMQRCPDEAAFWVESMEQQHRTLHAPLDSVNECAARYRAAGGVVERDYLAQFVEGVLDPLHEHLTTEKREILPLIDRYLTSAEWAAVGEHACRA
jgi:hemerythrin-like domain-containing protein